MPPDPPYNLYQAMDQTWHRISSSILADESELRRRLARREKTFNRVPRALCLSIRATDHRLTPALARISPCWATAKGREIEHEVLLTTQLLRTLCRPVEVLHGEPLTDLANYIGCTRQTSRRLERNGLINVRTIPLLRGRRGRPVPIMDGSRILDPGAHDKSAPHELLQPLWQQLTSRLPHDIAQPVIRRPIKHLRAHGRENTYWYWVCPSCKREVRQIFFPVGAPNWARLRNIKLPEGELYETPHQPNCFACAKCHHVQGLSFASEALNSTWPNLILHLSGGLLYGHEVPRPPNLCGQRKKKLIHPKRKSPRRDEMERYLAETDLPPKELARRFNVTYRTILTMCCIICRKHNLHGGRQALKTYWLQTHPPATTAAAAA